MELPLTDVTLVVLAGGQGRRMGGLVKPTLRHPSGETVLDRVLRTLGPISAESWLVAPESLHGRLKTDHSVKRVIDPGQGPPRALAAVCAQVGTPWVAAVAGDMVNPSLLALLTLANRRTDALDAVVNEVDGHPQTLFALYRARAWRTAVPRSLRQWLAIVRTERVTTEDQEGVFADVDTPEEALRFRLSGGEPYG